MSKTPSTPPRMLRTVVPMVGEDVRSVAVRYAKLKRLDVGDVMVAGLGVEERQFTSLPLKASMMGKFADLIGTNAASLREGAFGSTSAGFELFGCPADIDMIVPHRRRLAPGMLRSDGEKPWIRAHWQVACLPCDPETGETLIHLCPECLATLSWMRVGDLHRCDQCEVDLRDCQPRYASERDRDLSSLMAGLLRREPSALERLPSLIAKAPRDEQLDFLSWLGVLRPLVNGVIVPPGPFATFRGLEAAVGFPDTFNRMVADLMASHEQRDPRFGRLVGTMEMRLRARSLMPGKIRTSIGQRLDRLVGMDEIKGVIAMPGHDFDGLTGTGSFRLDYPECLRLTERSIAVWGQALSGLGDRHILLAP